MRDTVTIGAIGGVISTVIFEVTDIVIAYLLGFNYTPAWHAGANIYLNPDLIQTPAGILIGLTNSLFLGGSLGVLIAIVIRISGKDYYLIKGVGTALMWRMGTFGILAPVAQLTPHMKGEIGTQLLALLNFIIIGSVTSIIVAKYMKKPRKIH